MDKVQWIRKFRKAERKDKFSFIVSYCKGKTVLDVGCIGQDKGVDHNDWLHGRIQKVAERLVGSDINSEEIGKLNSQGFEIYLPEELNANDQYDLIVMGDVIEHVNDPGAFLSFYSDFLKPDGEMIICTPNSFGIRYFIQVLVYGKPGTNDEHTISFDPYVILELFKRINLKPVEFYWLKEYKSGSNFQQRSILVLASFFILLRRYFNPNFMYIVQRNND